MERVSPQAALHFVFMPNKFPSDRLILRYLTVGSSTDSGDKQQPYFFTNVKRQGGFFVVILHDE